MFSMSHDVLNDIIQPKLCRSMWDCPSPHCRVVFVQISSPFRGLLESYWGCAPRLGGYHIIRQRTGYRISHYTTTYTTYTTTYKASHSLTPTSHIRASFQRVIGLDGWWLLLLYKSILLCGKYTIYSMHLAPPACKRGLYPPCVTHIRV